MAAKATRVINAAANVLVGVIAVFAILIVAGKPFGFHAYAVLSGSMEPEYHTGSLIYVKETDASQLGPGDVITFMTGKDTTVTHRIVDEVQGEDGVTRFQTQGDANDSPDGELVHPDNVVGTPVVAVPLLGYAVNFIQFPPGTYIAISIGAIAVFLMFLPDLFSKGDDDEEEVGEGEREGSRARRSGKARGSLPAGAVTGHAGYAQGRAPQAGYAHAAQAAGYGGSAYPQQRTARQQQVVQRAQSASPQAAQPRQSHAANSYQPADARRAHAVSGQTAQRQADRKSMPQQVRSAQRAAAQPQQARPMRQQSAQPAQAARVAQSAQPSRAQQARTAQPAQPARAQHARAAQPAQRPTSNASRAATNAAGANNPRLRGGSGKPNGPARNAPQTHQQQEAPARRPSS